MEQNLRDDYGDHEYEIWSGEIIGPRRRGEFMLSRSPEGLISGHIHFNGVYYEIRPINYGDALLLEKDPTVLKGGVCGWEPVSGTIDFEERINNANSSAGVPFCDPLPPGHLCRKTWTILNVYTDVLYDQIFDFYYYGSFGGNSALLSLATAMTLLDLSRGMINFSLTVGNSGLDHTKLNYISTSVPHSSIATPKGSNTDLQWIYNDRVAFETYAKQNFSPIYDQDIAILQTQRTYGEVYGIADGVPVSINGYNDDLGESALVTYGGIGYPWYAFAHELGHCFGGHHDNADTDGLCNRGYKFRSNYNGPDRTVMAFLSSDDANTGKGSILYFSSPSLTYDGYALGTTSRYNQRVVQNVLCENVGESAPLAVEKAYLDLRNSPETTVFPNPTSGKVYLILEKETDLIQLLDARGKVLQSVKPSENPVNFDLSKLVNGTYWIRNIMNKSSETYKVIKND